MRIEICAGNIDSAINAQNGGAHRIELCAELSVGGITPSFGVIKEIIKLVQIPVFVLIRPRGGDFCYSVEEFSAMKMDIEICKELGCTGIVSGVLNQDLTVDVQRTSELVELSKPLEFTFHRAFDRVRNPFEALEELKKLDVNRILTSGQQSTAEKGLGLLIQLQKQAGKGLKILPGGGINPSNFHLFKENGFEEVHASVSISIKRGESTRFENSEFFISDSEKIVELVKLSRE